VDTVDIVCPVYIGVTYAFAVITVGSARTVHRLMESLGYDDWWYTMAQLCAWYIYDSIILAATKTHQVETSSQHSGGQGMVGLPMEAKEVTLE